MLRVNSTQNYHTPKRRTPVAYDYQNDFKHEERGPLIDCPQCGKPSPSIKIFRFPIIFYLLIFWYLTTKPVAACTSCQRLNILTYAGINVLTMHVLWIFVYPFVIAYFFFRTTVAGHSSDVTDLMNMRR
jgi:hypothetical protein